MTAPAIDQIAAYLNQRVASVLPAPFQLNPIPSAPDEQRFAVTAHDRRLTLKVYVASSAESARREMAGLALAHGIGIGPALVFSDETGATLGGPVVLVEEPSGDALGERRLSAEEAHDWLFLLLTLHHLPAERVSVASSMSPDAATWWQRTQSAWDECRTLYAEERFRSLVEALTKLHTIVGVHIEVNKGLWAGVPRRPCHGNPVPAHLVRSGGRLMLVEWSGFGLGDPAMEVGRAAALAALSGELSAGQYVQFIADYLAGMRDGKDPALEERLRVFASILPLGFCFVMLRLLAHGRSDQHEYERGVEQVSRALIWIQDTLGVEVGSAQELVAPLRAAVH
jgi:hypothetical protein